MMDVYEQAAEKIIKEQENIIGPLAKEQAQRAGLDVSNSHVKFQGDKVVGLQKLVEQYQKLFGQTSVEVCKDAASSFLSKLPANEVPSLLR